MTEEFVTIDSVTGHLPAAVEDRINAIAGTSGGTGGGFDDAAAQAEFVGALTW